MTAAAGRGLRLLGHAGSAATLELLPVPAADAADYLDGLNRDDAAPQWTELTAHLREHPDSVVAHALDSPLTLTLLRDHADADLVRDLLTPGRFNVREEVENALLDAPSRPVNTERC